MNESNTLMMEPSWQQKLAKELKAPYMNDLNDFLQREKDRKKVIYPKAQEVFQAFECTPFEKVKVVLLGQDPYHGPGQAHGLCFSVQKDVRTPPSLVNIYKELQNDLNIAPPKHGYLEAWAKQGVLLLNSVLTVEQAMAASHQGKGWERFTDKVIECLNADDRPKAFVLWGAYAQKKGQAINNSAHLVLKAPHPSPLSAHRGFFNSRPFSKINSFLEKNGQPVIDWHLPDDY